MRPLYYSMLLLFKDGKEPVSYTHLDVYKRQTKKVLYFFVLYVACSPPLERPRCKI